MTRQTWSTNCTLDDIAARIARSPNTAVLTHTKPDGDAIGSSLALVRAIAASRHTSASSVASPAEAWYTGPMPIWFGSVQHQTRMRSLDGGDQLPPHEPDLVVIVDTGSWTQLDRLADWVRAFEGDVIVIDHHLAGDADVAAMRYIDTSAAAACEPVAGVCTRLLNVASPARLNESIAEPLYLGLATDTGWFRHSNVSPAVFRLAGDLVEAGVQHEQLFQNIEQRDRAARLGLMARALTSLEFALGGAAAIMTLTQKDFEETGAAPQDVGGIVDLPRCVESVRVSALLTEQRSTGEPLTKISMRSKGGPGMIDVNVVSRAFGGGGHAQAAGARTNLSLAQAKAKLIEVMS